MFPPEAPPAPPSVEHDAEGPETPALPESFVITEITALPLYEFVPPLPAADEYGGLPLHEEASISFASIAPPPPPALAARFVAVTLLAVPG